MKTHILKQWDYLVVAHNKDYYYNKYTADIPYCLKLGDLIYKCQYEGRGYWFRGIIGEVSESGILLLDTIHVSRESEERPVFLPFDHEPEGHYIKRPEARMLEFCPFPPFKVKPNFKNISKLSDAPFEVHSRTDYVRSGPRGCWRLPRGWHTEDYIPNLKNIGLQQLSIFG